MAQEGLARASELAVDARRFSVGASAGHRTIVVDGVRLAYDDDGEGAPIIGLHATAHGSRDFELVRPLLQRGHRVITLDWPGHGRSSADRKSFSARRCEELLAGFYDALGIDRATLIGCSIGGAAALRYAVAHPSRVRSVVACNPGGLAEIDRVSRVFCKAMAAVGRAGQRGSWWFSPVFAHFCKQVLPSARASEQRARIVEQGAACGRVLDEAWRSFADGDADIRGLASGLEVPVLFAWAARDRIVALAASRAAIARVPRHELVTFDAGHCAFLETPGAFGQAFEDFERRLSVEAG